MQVHWVVYLVPPVSWEAVPIARNPKVLLVLALALGLAGAPWPGPASAQGEAMLVRVDTVRRVPLSQTVPVIGRLVAQQAGVVAARINGPVEAFRVEVGDRIEAGQTIAVLNAAALEARRDLYAGRLNEARAQLSIEKAQLMLARQDHKRLEKLKKSAAFNQARFDDARQRVVIAKAEMRQAETAIAAAKADLGLAEINLYNAEIRAPYAGVVTERLTEAGAYVQVGDPVVRMINDRTLEVEADVPFQHLDGLEVGIEVRLRLDDDTDHSAVVRARVPSENPLTRTRCTAIILGRLESIIPNVSNSSKAFHMPKMPVPPPVGYKITSGKDQSSDITLGSASSNPIVFLPSIRQPGS